MKLRTSSYEYYFRSKTHRHLLSSQKNAFRLAQLEERAGAEWEAGMSLPNDAITWTETKFHHR